MKLFRNLIVAPLVALALAGGAQAASLTNAGENSIVDWLLRGQTFTPPATSYIALYTVCPTDSTTGTEVTGGSYARVAVASSLANWAGTQGAGTTVASSGTSGTTSNNGAITYPAATADLGTVNCFGVNTASSGGTLLIYAPLTTPRSITNGSTASFAVGALTFQIDD